MIESASNVFFAKYFGKLKPGLEKLRLIEVVV